MQKRLRWGFTTILITCLIFFFVFETGYFAAKPTVATAAATVQEDSVTLNGVIKDGTKISQYGFKWGESKSLGEKAKLGSTVKANTSYKTTLNGLKAGCTYYYQAYALNNKGCGYGEIKSFTVPENEAPVVTITNPEDKAEIKVGEVVAISAEGKDDQKIANMTLYINDTLQTKVSSDTINYAWNTGEVQPGDYTLRLTASDGSKTTEEIATITLLAAEESAQVDAQPADNSGSNSNDENNNSNNAGNNSNVEASRGGTTDTSKYPKLSKVNGIFGQFYYRELSGGRIEVDPNWVAQNIVTITLPGLNQKVQVHRLAADNFIAAFTYIKNGTAIINGKEVSLLSLIKTMDGTYVTRHVNWNPSRGLSNHSWGTAIDINADDHFCYVDSATDPNMILWEKAFKPAGFSWGNRYSDSMHYELIK